MSTLKIENLHVSVGEKEILKGINVTINTVKLVLWVQMAMVNLLCVTIMGHP